MIYAVWAEFCQTFNTRLRFLDPVDAVFVWRGGA